MYTKLLALQDLAFSQFTAASDRVAAGGSRTCIQTVGVELDPSDLTNELVQDILQDTQLVYFDGRFPECAVILAKAARDKQIPVLVECERPRENLDELLLQADYLCTSAHFPKVD